ncbi:MAG TPA: hypothetical protein VGN23_14640 [Verrucomicrobiae bacterium]|jgi:hypothetical protein
MKTKYLMIATGLTAWCAVQSLFADDTAAKGTTDFAYTVPFELGDTEFASGDSITIQEVRGTSDEIRAGGTYCVTGTYTLSSEDSASLNFFETTTNPVMTPVGPQQTMRVQKGAGSFRLIMRMADPGYLHVTFYAHHHGIGGVYFGQGQWVLHHKQFSYHAESSRPEAGNLPSSNDPNAVLYGYLGDPVAPPANLDAAYTKEGLIQGMQTAAQKTGVKLVKLEIDDSEFPYLVGVAFVTKKDTERFKAQLKKMPGYSDTGGVGGETTYAMNLVPGQAYPPGIGDRIDHRMILRELVLLDKLQGE